MAPSAITQLVRAQILMREVNERVAEVLDAERDDALEFLCECSNADCVETIALSHLEYKGIRSMANLFVIVPGHECAEVDKVVEQHERFTLVEKTEHVDLVVLGWESPTGS